MHPFEGIDFADPHVKYLDSELKALSSMNQQTPVSSCACTYCMHVCLDIIAKTLALYDASDMISWWFISSLLAGSKIGNFFACTDGHMATQQDLITSGATVFVSVTEQPACLQVCVCCCGGHKAGL